MRKWVLGSRRRNKLKPFVLLRDLRSFFFQTQAVYFWRTKSCIYNIAKLHLLFCSQFYKLFNFFCLKFIKMFLTADIGLPLGMLKKTCFKWAEIWISYTSNDDDWKSHVWNFHKLLRWWTNYDWNSRFEIKSQKPKGFFTEKLLHKINANLLVS